MENKLHLSAKQKIWNDALKATLIELRKYDGMLTIDERNAITYGIFGKLKKGGITHNFKPLQY